MKKQKIESLPILPMAKEFMMRYGEATIENRALPDYRDGCKPVHRRLLYGAYTSGNNYNSPFTKSAKLVGHCFGAGTLVSTPKGKVAIENLNIGDEVLTSKGISVITACFENPPSEMVELEMEDGTTVIATTDQKFKVKTPNGEYIWKSVTSLDENDLIVCEV